MTAAAPNKKAPSKTGRPNASGLHSLRVSHEIFQALEAVGKPYGFTVQQTFDLLNQFVFSPSDGADKSTEEITRGLIRNALHHIAGKV